ncbi:MAG: ThuA domain-containing protein [Planctomycetota bacterium]
MRQTLVMFALFGMIVGAAAAHAAEKKAEEPKINVLLITGDDVSAHNWREISEATRKVLVDSGKFDVKVAEDPMILDSAAALKPYDVIVFTIFTTKKTASITDQAKENLLNFIKGGKGFFVQHLASGSYPDWPEFGKLVGRKWVMKTSGHGPRSVFETRVVNADHPITKGMTGFKIDDELYAKLQGDEPIEVLVEADSDWSNRTEPLVFTRTFGEGRMVHNAMGHDGTVITDPNVAKLIVRGVEWAARGEVK